MRDDIEPRCLKATIDSIKAYRKAYKLVRREGRKDGSLGRVEAVLLSFAVEKGLKAVLFYWDSKSSREIRRDGGHDLLKLYNLLRCETRGQLILLSGAKPRHVGRALVTNAKAYDYAEHDVVINEDNRILLWLFDITPRFRSRRFVAPRLRTPRR